MSKGCDWFEREGSLRVERGESLDPHVSGCAACRRAHARYLRLGAMVRRTYMVTAPALPSDLMRRLQKVVAGAITVLLGFFAQVRRAAAATSTRTVVTLGLVSGLGAAGLAKGIVIEVPAAIEPAGSADAPAWDERAAAPSEIAAVPDETAAPAPTEAASAQSTEPAAPTEPAVRRARPRVTAPAHAWHRASTPGDGSARTLMLDGLCFDRCRAAR